MNTMRFVRRSLNFLTIFAITLVLVLGTGVTTIQAGPGPNTPVSDDPNFRFPAVKIEAGVVDSPSFEGTGNLADAGVDQPALKLDGAEMPAKLTPAPVPQGPEVVIGWDTRQRLYTTYYPARAVVLITFNNGNSCSGSMIGSNTVMTAGHCVHSGGSSGHWYLTSGYRIYPGYNGTVAPYGSCTAKSLHSVTGWTVSGSESFDYGAIKLNCTIGNTVGFFGFWWQSASLVGRPTIIQGYPGDKPKTQWLSADVVKVQSTYQVFYYNDTAGGQSGSGIWTDRNDGGVTGPYIFGIHAYGKHGVYPHNTFNHGIFLRQAVYNNYVNWKAAP